MTIAEIGAVLDAYRGGGMDRLTALERLSGLPSKELGFAVLDSQRVARQGLPEVIYAEGKSVEHFTAIFAELCRGDAPVLATRVRPEQWEALRLVYPGAAYDPVSRTLRAKPRPLPPPGSPYAAIVTAGTSDIATAEEAAITVEAFGHRAERIYDVGVAGIHRLFARLEDIRGASAVVAIAGMEGALASVIGGLVAVPVVAVPTSVGYGANFAGLAALLSMVNSCAAGVSVVNIDNGFGAGYIASMLCSRAHS
jgi:pyridinium-3,5-biscarboxylic acid mononucleotide synthase